MEKNNSKIYDYEKPSPFIVFASLITVIRSLWYELSAKQYGRKTYMFQDLMSY